MASKRKSPKKRLLVTAKQLKDGVRLPAGRPVSLVLKKRPFVFSS